MSQTITIKGMVCDRCILTIQKELTGAGLQITDIKLGLVKYNPDQNTINWELVELRLNALGFQLLEDRKTIIVNEVKKLVQEIYSGDFYFPYSFRFSKAVTNRLLLGYDYISAIFSSQENITVEKYLLDYRLEKAKDFLVYSSKSISDISYCLGFNSIAHMSRQFKSFTGLTPSYFRSVGLSKQSLPKTTSS